jgi:hypothetical protein
MATNQYFNKFSNSAEQRLVQDLVDEAIKINGVDMVYIPRSVMNEDEIFGEDRLPKFESGRQLEMYIENYDGYEGGGEEFSSIGLEINDRMTVVLSRRRFLEVFADKNYSYPREGDLIYFPLNKDVFEINFVDREYNFFNFGKSMGYKIECSLFKFTGGDFDTGFDAVDGVTSAAMDQLFVAVLGTGTGTFTEGELSYLYTSTGTTGATMNTINWNATAKEATLQLVEGSINNADRLFGNSSGATYAVTSIGVTNEFFTKDPLQNNTDFGFGSSSFLDFTDTDPFSEGDL